MNRRPEKKITEPPRCRGFGTRPAVESDYEGVRPSRGRSTDAAVFKKTAISEIDKSPRSSKSNLRLFPPLTKQQDSVIPVAQAKGKWTLKRGHAFTYAALLLFTIVLYVRPAELYPSPLTASIALIVGLATLAFFIPSQLALEGTFTARPPEISLVLLFLLTGLLSIPLAIDPLIAWQEFSGTFIRCIVIFIVIVNVLRTRSRLNGLLFVAIGSALWLSVDAINDFRLGVATVEGYRAAGRGSGIFGNTNDMALHLVTILPITIALFFGSKRLWRKFIFAAFATVILTAIVLSYSRGAFLGLIVVLIFMALKLGPRHRLGVVLSVIVLGGAVLLFTPDNYGGRLLSIFIPSLDPGGSADARRGELVWSFYVSIRNPFLGIGMGNYAPLMSYRGQVSHNAFTQVSVEMGLAALACYTLFIVLPLRKLGQIARETFGARYSSNYYYLAVGLQASLIGYMVSSFFLSVAYLWYVYYLVGFAVCLRRLYEAETGKVVTVVKRKEAKRNKVRKRSPVGDSEPVTT